MIEVKNLLDLGLASDCRVGLGLPESALETVRRRLAEAGSGLRVLSFESIHSMVSALKGGQVDCAVRGTLSSAKVIETIKETFSVRLVMRTAVLETPSGGQFLLCPVGIDEGANREARLEIVERTLEYFSKVGWKMKIGILSKGRPEDWGRSDEIATSLKDGEWLVGKLRAKGMDAEHYSILIEKAVAESDLIVAPDGISGNLIFRSMHFLGSGKAYGAPIVNMARVFVDTSRAKRDFFDSVLLAAGLVQARAGT